MKRILVVEDDKKVRENIFQLLKMSGFDVLTAVDGEQGIKIVNQNPPDLIVCDILMPKLNGYEVRKRLNKNAKYSSIPFIFLTAKTEMEDLRIGMKLGADDYLVKPYKVQELIDAINLRLDKKENIVAIEKGKIISEIKYTEKNGDSILLIGNPPKIIKIENIVFVNSENGYSIVNTSNSTQILVRKQMKEWENLLNGNGFIRIHNSIIVNLLFIERFEKWFNNSYKIYLKTQQKPLIASRRYSSILRSLIQT